MKSFAPRLDILPEPQRRLWRELGQMPRHFVLYGGTAIALRAGHRQSVDFDFFSSDRFESEALLQDLPLLQGGKILQSAPQTLTVLVQRNGPVKLSFFGGLTVGRVGVPEQSEDGVLCAASLLDLAGMKAAVVQKRAEAKDYLDLLALMKLGVSLPESLGAALALYPDQFNPMVTLKALTYFADGDLPTLTPAQQTTLIKAVSSHFTLPVIKRVAETLSA